MRLALFVAFLATACSADSNYVSKANLTERFKWKYLDYAWPSEEAKQQAIENGEYIAENNIPVGLEFWGNKMFIGNPRWRSGVPATLTYLPLDQAESDSPKLIPYPSWEENKAGACKLSTIDRPYVDSCDRLWAIDDGVMYKRFKTRAIDTICPPVLHIFDLKTDKILRRYQLNSNDLNNQSLIANMIVDIGPGGCDDAFAYMADTVGIGLVVYSFARNTSWRFEHKSFEADPKIGSEGPLGLALSDLDYSGYRTLFYHPVDSHDEYSVSTRILRHPSAKSESEFIYLDTRGPKGQSASEIMNDDGIMFFTLINKNAIGCWNSLSTPYETNYHDIVVKDDEALVYPSDIKLYQGDIWVLSNRMDDFAGPGLNYSDYNYRVLSLPIKGATRGTICDENYNYYS